MQVLLGRATAGIVAVVLIVCVLGGFISPVLSGLPAHLRHNRTAGKLLGQFAQPAYPVAEFHSAACVSAIVEFAKAVPTIPILRLICVRIC